MAQGESCRRRLSGMERIRSEHRCSGGPKYVCGRFAGVGAAAAAAAHEGLACGRRGPILLPKASAFRPNSGMRVKSGEYVIYIVHYYSL